MALGRLTVLAGAWLCLAPAAPAAAAAEPACPDRGHLDRRYCDADGDLVADAPTDPAKWRDPKTLVWAYAPIEDPAVYANLFKTFTRHLEACLGRQIAGVLAVATAGFGMGHDHTLRACLRALLGITRAECASLERDGDADSLRDRRPARSRGHARRIRRWLAPHP